MSPIIKVFRTFIDRTYLQNTLLSHCNPLQGYTNKPQFLGSQTEPELNSSSTHLPAAAMGHVQLQGGHGVGNGKGYGMGYGYGAGEKLVTIKLV